MERISLQTGKSRIECITKALEGYFENQKIDEGKEIAILPNMIPAQGRNMTGVSQFDAIKSVADFFTGKYDNINIVTAVPSEHIQYAEEILGSANPDIKIINPGDEDILTKFGVNQFEVFDKEGNLMPLEISAIPEKMPLVVLCVPKTHDRAAFTGNVKNQMGLITGKKGNMHNGYALNKLSDTLCNYNLTKLHEYMSKYEPLYVCDSYEAMEGNGPYGANMRQLMFGMVSKDAVALDSIALLLMNLVNHDGQILNPSDFAYLFMLNRMNHQCRIRYGTLFLSIDELFEYENLNANISKEELKDTIKKIGTLAAHRDIKDQYEASRAIIDAVGEDETKIDNPAEIIRRVAATI